MLWSYWVAAFSPTVLTSVSVVPWFVLLSRLLTVSILPVCLKLVLNLLDSEGWSKVRLRWRMLLTFLSRFESIEWFKKLSFKFLALLRFFFSPPTMWPMRYWFPLVDSLSAVDMNCTELREKSRAKIAFLAVPAAWPWFCRPRGGIK